LKFRDEAFITATFLINLLPSKVLNFETPTERLLHVTPNYDALRVFGCACWPNLHPYNKHKLAFRFKQCVFLGYSPLHKGVKCSDVSTGRIYISRHVVFDEQVFPFAHLHPNVGALLKKEILLLPSSTSSLHEGAHTANDHMSPVVPVSIMQQDDEVADENFVPNGAPSSSKITAETYLENATSSTENEDGSSEHSLGLADPEGDAPVPLTLPGSGPGPFHAASPPTAGARGCHTHSRPSDASATGRAPPGASVADSPTRSPLSLSSSSPVVSADSSAGSSAAGDIGEQPAFSAKSSEAPPPPSPPRVRTRLQKGIRNPKQMALCNMVCFPL
jgi:hypothetical protein